MLTDQSKELPVRSVSEHPIQSPVLHRLYKDHFVSGYPDAISHLKAGLSEDTRQVAFAVTELTVLDGV